jgi:hypothetical protein
MKLTTHLHLVLRLRMVGAIHHSFICSCGVHMDNFIHSHESSEIALKFMEPLVDREHSFVD